ncbi:hypothetical protein V8J88_21630 [Massilia sp. W12]|uniref:Tse2 family ADP-ribosyltransferase toxin n=1 Tax=Massilia sp. W12 TaxID=3126507 RepID=UPI0030CAA059
MVALTELDLYRSIRVEQFPMGPIIESQPAPEILYPDFEEKELPNGSFRKPDTQPFVGDDGELWVQSGKGTSLFDKPGVFKTKGWLSFTIPKGTQAPDSLILRFTGYNERFKADHYQIEPKARLMRLDAYKGALDNLARAALARAVELAKNSESGM